MLTEARSFVSATNSLKKFSYTASGLRGGRRVWGMEGLRWTLLQAIFLLLLVSKIGNTEDFCKAVDPNLHYAQARPASICDTPYCICNNPFGRISCSCIPQNSSLPKATEIIIRSAGHCKVRDDAQDLVIEDCPNVTIPAKELGGLPLLRLIQLKKIRELTLVEHSFHWPSDTPKLRVEIFNSNIAILPSYAFSGHISNILFDGVYFGSINEFSISSITDTDLLMFSNCTFAKVEPQSFKKFSTNQFIIKKSTFDVIPSRFVFEVHVHRNFIIEGSIINILRTRAFQVTHPTSVAVTKSRITTIEGEAFYIKSKGRVTFQNNFFETIESGAFRGIGLDRPEIGFGKHEFLFDNNTLGTFTREALSFNRTFFHVVLSQMLIDDTCSCDTLTKWSDTLYPRKQNEPIEPNLKELWCHVESQKEYDYEYVSGEQFYTDYCTPIISSIYFLVIVVVTTVVGLCVLIIVIIIFLKRRQKWDIVPTTDVPGVTTKKPPQVKGLVVPDGRVYRETEFHVIEEKVEPLQEVQPYRVTRDRSKVIVTKAPLHS